MIALASPQSNILDEVIHGEALAVLRTLPDNSVDAIVCDPPAGISFMGKEWDKADTFPLRDRGKLNGTSAHAPHAHERGFANGIHVDNSTRARDAFISFIREVMAEALRVLKPGGHAFVWALPRTSHWTGMALEDAGFEIRDVVTHLFGSGFPKSADISKAIDKMHGAEREVIGHKPKMGGVVHRPNGTGWDRPWQSEPDAIEKKLDITAPATPEASQWDGWGTALKPASEHWWLCRKPLSESSIAANVLEWGTGSLAINATRVRSNTTDRFLEYVDGIASRVGYIIDSSNVYTNHDHDTIPLVDKTDKLLDALLNGSSLPHANGARSGQSFVSLLGSLCDCPACFYSYDALSRLVAMHGLNAALSLNDAHRYSHLSKPWDVQRLSQLRTHLCECISLLSILDYDYRHEYLYVPHHEYEQLYHAVLRYLELLLESNHTCGIEPLNCFSSQLDTLVKSAIQFASQADNWDEFSFNLQCYIDTVPQIITSLWKSVKSRMQSTGRWPANLLLSHSVWCVPNGVKRVRTSSHSVGKNPKEYQRTNNIFAENGGKATPHDYLDSEGMEQVEDWLCDESCPIRLLDEQSGYSVSKAGNRGRPFTSQGSHEGWKRPSHEHYTDGYSPISDQGGASRYFMRFYYCSKASRSERNKGCEGLPEKEGFDKNTSKMVRRSNPDTGEAHYNEYHPSSNRNSHPTVKPVNLMRYLVRMITPPGGIVLDCFAGSGSTLVAAIYEGMHFIGIEMNDSEQEPYVTIARARIEQAFREVQS